MLDLVRNGTGDSENSMQPEHGARSAIIVSTRPPKAPLSGGMAPAVREASKEFDDVKWFALGSEGDKTAMRKSFDGATGAPLKPPMEKYEVEGFKVRQIQLTKDQWTSHYDVFSNQWVWPLCHNLMQFAKKTLSRWDIHGNEYSNEQLADDIKSELDEENDTTSPIMIQDYHHFELGMFLRKADVKNPIIFFNHIPLPTIETMNKMGRKEREKFTDMMKSLLECDSMQFQTEETARRFLKIIGYDNPPEIGKYKSVLIPVKVDGQPDRMVRVGHAPISINVDKVLAVSRSAEPLESSASVWLEEQLVAPNVLINFERIDYTKGIKERAQAFKDLLAQNPDLRGNVQLLLQAEPTRADIPEYKKYAEDVKAIVAEINADKSLWIGDKPPVVFLHQNIPNNDLLKIIYRTKEVVNTAGETVTQKRIGTVTPFEDGMNLTAKELAVANSGNALILSAGAGAAAELDMGNHGAVVYRPSETGNTRSLVTAMVEAINMTAQEAKIRALMMLQRVKENTIQDWGRYMKNEADAILESRTSGRELNGGPKLAGYSLDI